MIPTLFLSNLNQKKVSMLQIITKAPFYVWPLFALLLINGFKARKSSTIPLRVLLFIPVIFFGWSLSSFFERNPESPVAILLWVVSLGAGIWLGYAHLQKHNLQFDQQHKKVEMPGSWVPLFLSMSIFCTKYALGMMRAVLPHLNGSTLFLVLELFCAVILGVFAGRAINCYLRFRRALRTEAV